MQTETCYDLDMSDPYTKKGVQDYSGTMRCIMIKEVGYFFIPKKMEISQDKALRIAEMLAGIGTIPHDAKESNPRVQPAATEPAEQAGRGPLGCDESLGADHLPEGNP